MNLIIINIIILPGGLGPIIMCTWVARRRSMRKRAMRTMKPRRGL